MKTLNQLEEEFKQVKEDMLYHYFVAITNKIEEMMRSSPQEIHNGYYLKETHIVAYKENEMGGLQIYFIFFNSMKQVHESVNFNTNQIIGGNTYHYDHLKISPKMKNNLEYFFKNLFIGSQRDISQMIARRLIENKNDYYYDISKPQTWPFISKSIMGETFYKRYELEQIKEEKDKLEKSLNTIDPNNQKKLKV